MLVSDFRMDTAAKRRVPAFRPGLSC